MLILEHAHVLTPDSRLDDAAVWIDRGIIRKIGSPGLTIPLEAEHLDLSNKIVAPGFIDLQLNGAFGDDFTANPETIWRVAAQLPRFGVTSFLPTLVTSPLENARAARQALQARPPDFRGAEPLGLHVEGPFLNPKKKGAHNPKYLLAPDVTLAADWSRENGVWLVTLAPELPGALALARSLTARGVIVGMGHTLATLDEANAGYDAGIRYATHLFNAMPPLEHRAPGAAGAVLSHPEWLTGIIPDGIHVHPALVKMVWFAKGAHGVNLVSDAMAALGKRPGKYRLNDFDCTVSESDARLEDGTLAGSILALDQAVRNLIDYTGCTLPEALGTVTLNPARLLNIQHRRGCVAEGMIADLVVLNESLDVEMTITHGQVTYTLD